MRFIGSLLVVLFASAAGAVRPPGPPPWSCRPDSVCDTKDVCKNIPLPLDFELRQSDREKEDMLWVNHYGDERRAVIFQSLDEAKDFVRTDRSRGGSPIILVRSNFVADAYGFLAYGLYSRAGSNYLSETHLRLVCGRGPIRP